MKLMKKLSAILLSLCLLVPCFSMVANAAGRISFSDPSTAVGEYVEVKCVLRSESGNIGEVSVDLSFDESYLRFDSGDGIEETGSGSLTCSGTGNSTEITFYAKFQALQEGTTTVDITGTTVTDENGTSITFDQGNSTITIAEGDPSKIEDSTTQAPSAGDVEVDVNGVMYTLTDEFADTDIPNGYSRTQKTLDGEERQMVENESGNICLGYLKDADAIGSFFLYNEENATFSPYAEISISDTMSIIVLSDTSEVTLDSRYSEAKLSLNEKEFPVWQDTEKEGIYVIYAMNSLGETGYYQYDSVEGTYQRFEPSTVTEKESDAGNDTSSVLGKIQNIVEANLAFVILVAGVGAILGLLILIILAVKLHNRNAELDELYDEYGIDLEEEEEEEVKPSKKELKKAEKAAKKEAKKEAKKARKQEAEEDFEEADFEEAEADFEEADFEEAEESFEEAEFEEADFEEADFEDDFADFREAGSISKQQMEEEFAGYTERMDFTIDDLDDLLEEKSEKKHGHIEDDDTFKIDFIDLD